jgi:hypothetical protein
MFQNLLILILLFLKCAFTVRLFNLRHLKKRKMEMDVAISSSSIDKREKMLVHEIRLSNVLNMVSSHDDLKALRCRR